MKAFQRPFQRLEPQAVFAGFRKLSRDCSNVWNGSAHRLSQACQRLFNSSVHRLSVAFRGFPEAVPTVGTAVLTGFHRFQRPFQWLEQQRESFRETVPTFGTAAFTGIHFHTVHRLPSASGKPVKTAAPTRWGRLWKACERCRSNRWNAFWKACESL